MEELWRPVVQCNVKLPDGNWKYEVSNLGRVRRNEFRDKANVFRKGRIYQGSSVSLTDGSSTRSFLVHLLVATAFIENPKGYKSVIHLDGNMDNNAASNLQWGKASGVRRRPVNQYNEKGELVKTYEKVVSASRETGIEYDSIYNSCVSKSTNLLNGCFWRFVDDDEIAATGVLPIPPEVIPDFIRQYDCSGKLVNSYESIYVASKTTGVGYQSIYNCCYRINATGQGYIWRFKTNDEIEQGVIPKLPSTKRPVRQYTLDKKFVAEYESITEALESLGRRLPSISNCCSRKPGCYSCGGFIWRYVDDDELYEAVVK